MSDAAPAPDTAPAPTPDTAPAPAPAPADAPWHGITDPAAAEYIANKGWQNPADVIKSYQGAEKLIGRDPSTLIPLPRADDPAGARTVLSKLGLPEDPAKYDFAKPPEGLKADEAYEAFARTAFHKAGLTNDMAKALTAEHNNYVASVLAQQEKDYAQGVEADKKALLAEWKGGHERMLNAAQSAAKALGFTPEIIDGIERELGYAGTWKFFAQLGSKMGEDKFVTPDGKAAFAGQLTPAEAKSQWEAMKADPIVIGSLQDVTHPSHKANKAKQDELFKVMYPEG